MFLYARKNGIEFHIVLCTHCPRASTVNAKKDLPVGWTAVNGGIGHFCPVCSLPDKKGVEVRAAARAERFLSRWPTPTPIDRDDLRQDLVAAFIEVEETWKLQP